MAFVLYINHPFKSVQSVVKTLKNYFLTFPPRITLARHIKNPFNPLTTSVLPPQNPSAQFRRLDYAAIIAGDD